MPTRASDSIETNDSSILDRWILCQSRSLSGARESCLHGPRRRLGFRQRGVKLHGQIVLPGYASWGHDGVMSGDLIGYRSLGLKGAQPKCFEVRSKCEVAEPLRGYHMGRAHLMRNRVKTTRWSWLSCSAVHLYCARISRFRLKQIA